VSFEKGASNIAAFATNIYVPSLRESEYSQKSARRRRFARLRLTAFPSFLVAVKPTLRTPG